MRTSTSTPGTAETAPYSAEDFLAELKKNSVQSLGHSKTFRAVAQTEPNFAKKNFYNFMGDANDYDTDIVPKDELMLALENLLAGVSTQPENQTLESIVVTHRESIKNLCDELVTFCKQAYKLDELKNPKTAKRKSNYLGIMHFVQILFAKIQKPDRRALGVLNYMFSHLAESLSVPFIQSRGASKENFKDSLNSAFFTTKYLETDATETEKTAATDLRRELDTAVLAASSLLNAEKTFPPQKQLDAGFELATPSWQDLGNYFRDFIQQEANVDMISATTDFSMGGVDRKLLLDPPVAFMQSRLANGHMITPEMLNILAQSFDRTQIKGTQEDPEGSVMIGISNESFIFKIKKDGEICITTDYDGPLEAVIGERNYLILRAALLHQAATLMVAQYQVKPLKEIITRLLPEGFNPNRRNVLRQMPRTRDLILTPNPEPAPQSEPSSETVNTRSPDYHWAPDHKRLLPKGCVPSAENYTRSLGRTPLRAFVIDPVEGKITATVTANDQPSYGEFLAWSENFIHDEEAKGNIVRFETTVKGHDTRQGPTPAEATRAAVGSLMDVVATQPEN